MLCSVRTLGVCAVLCPAVSYAMTDGMFDLDAVTARALDTPEVDFEQETYDTVDELEPAQPTLPDKRKSGYEQVRSWFSYSFDGVPVLKHLPCSCSISGSCALPPLCVFLILPSGCHLLPSTFPAVGLCASFHDRLVVRWICPGMSLSRRMHQSPAANSSLRRTTWQWTKSRQLPTLCKALRCQGRATRVAYQCQERRMTTPRCRRPRPCQQGRLLNCTLARLPPWTRAPACTLSHR